MAVESKTTSWWATPAMQTDRAAFAAAVQAREAARAAGARGLPAHWHRLTRKQRAQLAAREE